ncbi:Lipopolysaccharide-responsive and beige-like anchor protein [Giardia muris]|uniref:Lipopolysaccharide-responsive and beige-like anchor protein n=1 Tax=Giardia muris TaxID=5742 RepID=A0A4Z1SXT1_GIAMU|nr:Lipopolysaccharide-responsive and beige-like anchor protein [Giardia muris]|eukprot:TNJ29625.1 Lipopolysaccharide-responsive and beige-like anchor protein [Giardia muris]
MSERSAYAALCSALRRYAITFIKTGSEPPAPSLDVLKREVSLEKAVDVQYAPYAAYLVGSSILKQSPGADSLLRHIIEATKSGSERYQDAFFWGLAASPVLDHVLDAALAITSLHDSALQVSTVLFEKSIIATPRTYFRKLSEILKDYSDVTATLNSVEGQGETATNIYAQLCISLLLSFVRSCISFKSGSIPRLIGIPRALVSYQATSEMTVDMVNGFGLDSYMILTTELVPSKNAKKHYKSLETMEKIPFHLTRDGLTLPIVSSQQLSHQDSGLPNEIRTYLQELNLRRHIFFVSDNMQLFAYSPFNSRVSSVQDFDCFMKELVKYTSECMNLESVGVLDSCAANVAEALFRSAICRGTTECLVEDGWVLLEAILAALLREDPTTFQKHFSLMYLLVFEPLSPEDVRTVLSSVERPDISLVATLWDAYIPSNTGLERLASVLMHIGRLEGLNKSSLTAYQKIVQDSLKLIVTIAQRSSGAFAFFEGCQEFAKFIIMVSAGYPTSIGMESAYEFLNALLLYSTSRKDAPNVYGLFNELLAASETPYKTVGYLRTLTELSSKKGVRLPLLEASRLLDTLYKMLDGEFPAQASLVIQFAQVIGDFTNKVTFERFLEYGRAECSGLLVSRAVLLGAVLLQDSEWNQPIKNLNILCGYLVRAIGRFWAQEEQVDIGMGTILSIFDIVLLIHLYVFSNTLAMRTSFLQLLVRNSFDIAFQALLKTQPVLCAVFLAAWIHGTIPRLFCNQEVEEQEGMVDPNDALSEYRDKLINSFVEAARNDRKLYRLLVVLACPDGYFATAPVCPQFLTDINVLNYYLTCLSSRSYFWETEKISTSDFSQGMVIRYFSFLLPILLGGFYNTFLMLPDNEKQRVLPLMLLHPPRSLRRWLSHQLLEANENALTVLRTLHNFYGELGRVRPEPLPLPQMEVHSFFMYTEKLPGITTINGTATWVSGPFSAGMNERYLRALHLLLGGTVIRSTNGSIHISITSTTDTTPILSFRISLETGELHLCLEKTSYHMECTLPARVCQMSRLRMGLALSGFGLTDRRSNLSSYVLGRPTDSPCGITLSLNGHCFIIRCKKMPTLTLPFKVECNTFGALALNRLVASPIILTPMQVESLWHGAYVNPYCLFSTTQEPLISSEDSMSLVTSKLPSPASINIQTLIGSLMEFTNVLSNDLDLPALLFKYLASATPKDIWEEKLFKECEVLCEQSASLRFKLFFCTSCGSAIEAHYLLFDMLELLMNEMTRQEIPLINLLEVLSTLVSKTLPGYSPQCPICNNTPSSNHLVPPKVDLESMQLPYDPHSHTSAQSFLYHQELEKTPEELIFRTLRAGIRSTSTPMTDLNFPLNHLVSVVPQSSLYWYSLFLEAVNQSDRPNGLEDVLYRLGYTEPTVQIPFYSGLALLTLIVRVLGKILTLDECRTFLTTPPGQEEGPLDVQLDKLQQRLKDFFCARLVRQTAEAEEVYRELRATGILGSINQVLQPHDRTNLYSPHFIALLYIYKIPHSLPRAGLELLHGEVSVVRSLIFGETDPTTHSLLRKHGGIEGTVLISRCWRLLSRSYSPIIQPSSTPLVHAFGLGTSLTQHGSGSSCFLHSSADTNTKLFYKIVAESLTSESIFGTLNPISMIRGAAFPLTSERPVESHTVLPTLTILIQSGAERDDICMAFQVMMSLVADEEDALSGFRTVLALLSHIGQVAFVDTLCDSLIATLITHRWVYAIPRLWSPELLAIPCANDSIPDHVIKHVTSLSANSYAILSGLLEPSFLENDVCGLLSAYISHAIVHKPGYETLAQEYSESLRLHLSKLMGLTRETSLSVTIALIATIWSIADSIQNRVGCASGTFESLLLYTTLAELYFSITPILVSQFQQGDLLLLSSVISFIPMRYLLQHLLTIGRTLIEQWHSSEGGEELVTIARPAFQAILQLFIIILLTVVTFVESLVPETTECICSLMQSIITSGFEAAANLPLLTPTIDAFLSSLLSLLAIYIFYTPKTALRLFSPKNAMSFTFESVEATPSVVCMQALSILIPTTRCLQSLTYTAVAPLPRTFDCLVHPLTSLLTGCLSAETFKYCVGDLTSMLAPAQFLLQPSFTVGEIVVEGRRILSEGRCFVEMASPEEFSVYRNIQEFDHTLQVCYHVIASSELRRKFYLELGHIQRGEKSGDPTDQFYARGSRLISVAAHLHASCYNVLTGLGITDEIRKVSDDSELWPLSVAATDVKVMRSLAFLALKHVMGDSVSRASATVSIFISLLLTEHCSFGLLNCTSECPTPALLQGMEFLTFLCSCFVGTRPEEHSNLHYLPITQSIAVATHDENVCAYDQAIRDVHAFIVDTLQSKLNNAGSFFDTVFSAVTRLVARLWDATGTEESTETLLEACHRLFAAAFLAIIRVLASIVRTLDTPDVLLVMLTLYLSIHALAQETLLAERYNSLLAEILSLDLVRDAVKGSLGPPTRHNHTLDALLGMLEVDKSICAVCGIYLSGRPPRYNARLQLYKSYSAMLDFVTTQPLVGDSEGECSPSNTSPQKGRSALLECFGWSFNFSRFKVAQNLVNLLIRVCIESASLCGSAGRFIRRALPVDTNLFFYVLGAVLKLGNIQCISTLMTTIYGPEDNSDALHEILTNYRKADCIIQSTLQTYRFTRLVHAETYLYGFASLCSESMAFSACVSLAAQSSHSGACASSRNRLTTLVRRPSLPLFSRVPDIRSYLHISKELQRLFYFGGALHRTAGYVQANFELPLHIRSLMVPTTSFNDNIPTGLVLSFIYQHFKELIRRALTIHGSIRLGDVLPPDDRLLASALVSQTTSMLVPCEGTLIFSTRDVYFLPGWRILASETTYMVRGHTFTLPSVQEEATSVVPEKGESKLLSSLRGLVRSLASITKTPESDTTPIKPAPETPLRRLLTQITEHSCYLHNRPFSEYRIRPIVHIPESHTVQASLEQSCIADPERLHAVTDGWDENRILDLFSIVKHSFTDIEAVVWRNVARRPTCLDIAMSSKSVFSYEILDHISSASMRLLYYRDDDAFMTLVQEECRNGFTPKSLERFMTARLAIQGSAVLSASHIVLSLASLPQHPELILPSEKTFEHYLSRWQSTLKAFTTTSVTTDPSLLTLEQGLYAHPYEFILPQRINAMKSAYMDSFANVVQVLNMQICDIIDLIRESVTHLRETDRQVVSYSKSTYFTSQLLKTYHAEERATSSFTEAFKGHKTEEWSDFANEVTPIVLFYVGKLSSFGLIMSMNALAGRRSSDFSMYPVLPWMQNRTLSKAIIDQTQAKHDKYLERYDETASTPFLAGSFFSAPGLVVGMLLRMQPFTSSTLYLHGGRFDVPDRIFSNLEETWRGVAEHVLADCREFIPDIVHSPNALINESQHDFGICSNGVAIEDVVCSTYNADRCHIAASVLDTYLHVMLASLLYRFDLERADPLDWLRLVFGDLRQSFEHFNLFYWLTEHDSVVLDCIANLTTRVSTYSQLKGFGTGSENVLFPTSTLQSFVEKLRARGDDFVGQTSRKVRIYDYFESLTDLLRVARVGDFVSIKYRGEEEYVATACVSRRIFAVPCYLLSKAHGSDPSPGDRVDPLKGLYVLSPTSLLVLLQERRYVAIYDQKYAVCRSIDVIRLCVRNARHYLTITAIYPLCMMFVVVLSDESCYLIRLKPEPEAIQLEVPGQIITVTGSTDHGVLLVSYLERRDEQSVTRHILYNIQTGEPMTLVHRIITPRGPHSATCTQVCDLGGRIWIGENNTVACWTLSGALLYFIVAPSPLTAMLAISHEYLVLGSIGGRIFIYTLDPTRITDVVRVQITSNVTVDGEPGRLESLLCMPQATRPTVQDAISHTRYFRKRNVMVLRPTLLIELQCATTQTIHSIKLDPKHTSLLFNDRYALSLSPFIIDSPIYEGPQPRHPRHSCLTCSRPDASHYCVICANHFCPEHAPMTDIYAPYQAYPTPAHMKICKECQAKVANKGD